MNAATATATDRVFNFSAGPATMPLSVLEEIRDELLCLPGVGASVMEISHRSATFVDIMESAKASIRDLLAVPDDYAVLLMQGGSALQFSMVPANLLRGGDVPAHYMVTGSWSKKAIVEARKEGQVVTAFDSAATNFDRLPDPAESLVPAESAFLYYCSNETIQGVQFASEPPVPDNVPLACDVSSDFLSRPLDINRYGLLYACAQKNAGPAGVTVVIIRRDLLERSRDDLPGYLDYRNHDKAESMWNTPPTFAVYALGKVTRWLRDEVGGLAAIEKINREKADLLYTAVDAHPAMYTGHAQQDCRSQMNVTFKLPNDQLQAEFIKQAATHSLDALKGHRSVGGIRASIYNAMPIEGVRALADFMNDFASKNS
ncbi:MAG: 3-phosphoserine/phosphohydroxythreonine transaminase [Planctomycetota bacterium]